ncbi:MAG: ABC transporter substrate-binding protein [Bacillota bacterium]|nr:ABC transporter substrate-binding protein [Bacillota bacterium]
MKRTSKIFLALLLCLVFTFTLVACIASSDVKEEETAVKVDQEIVGEDEKQEEEPTTRIFTDSLGREVEVPANIEHIAITGPMAQIPVFALSPDKLVGVANPWYDGAEEYIDEKYLNLPELGQLYGGKGEMNLETLLSTDAQVVIDVGEAKDGAVEDLNNLQEQTGIPFVHVGATLSTMGDAFVMLGDLLGEEEKAADYAEYFDKVYKETVELAEKVDKKKALYITGQEGHNVIAQSSFHAEIMDMLTDNIAVVDQPSSRGTGNEVDMEQILAWNPDYIIFSPDSIYDTVGQDPDWQNITAIKEGNYYEVPQGPYNWMASPPSAQRILGLLWLSHTLYPEEAGFDLQEEVTKSYDMLFHSQLTDQQFENLVK